MKKIVYESTYTTVIEEGKRLIFKKKPETLLKIFILVLSGTLLSFLLSIVVNHTELDNIAWWTTCIFACISLLLALLIIYTLFFDAIIIDRIKQEIHTARKRILFSDILFFEVQMVTVMNNNLFCLVAQLKKEKIYLIEGQPANSFVVLRSLENKCNVLLKKQVAKRHAIRSVHRSSMKLS